MRHDPMEVKNALRWAETQGRAPGAEGIERLATQIKLLLEDMAPAQDEIRKAAGDAAVAQRELDMERAEYAKLRKKYEVQRNVLKEIAAGAKGAKALAVEAVKE